MLCYMPPSLGPGCTTVSNITPSEDLKIKHLLSDPNVVVSRLVQYPPACQAGADKLEALLNIIRATSPESLAHATQSFITLVIQHHY